MKLSDTRTDDLKAMLASLRSNGAAGSVPFYLRQVQRITDELERRSH